MTGESFRVWDEDEKNEQRDLNSDVRGEIKATIPR
jgi:hypothetical protein